MAPIVPNRVKEGRTPRTGLSTHTPHRRRLTNMSAEVSIDRSLPAWKLPTRETQAQLVLAARSRRPGARTRLVESFMPLIGSVARIYSRVPAVDRSELMQEGVV